MNLYGGICDFADGATSLLGSKNTDKLAAKTGKLSSALEDLMRDLPTTMEATANELKKSGLPAKLKEFAKSDDVANLTEQVGEIGEGLTENLSQFEEQTKELSEKFGSFFKDNL
jgi:hypothetical protein